MFPLVSVVIATYNQAEYLGYTIESVLNQTYPSIELIVVDDGSTDSTPDVAARFSGRITYIRQANAERGAARNRGLAEARGEFIAFLDSDDEWYPDKIACDLQRFEQAPTTGLVYSDVESIDSTGTTLHRIQRPACEGRVTKQILEANFVSIGAHLARTAPVRAIAGFIEDRRLSGSEDWVLWVQLSTTVDFAYLPCASARIRTHPGNTMSNAKAMERAMNRAVEILEASPWLSIERRRVFPRMRANIALTNAINFCTIRDRYQTWNYLRKAVQHRWNIIFDFRFLYTLLRSVIPASVSRAIASWRESSISTSG